jgi:hypothetical protein
VILDDGHAYERTDQSSAYEQNPGQDVGRPCGEMLAAFDAMEHDTERAAERRARLALHVNLLWMSRASSKTPRLLQLAKSTDIDRLAAQLSDTASAIPRQLDEGVASSG